MTGPIVDNIWKSILPFLIGGAIFLFPKPEMVDPKGWQLLAIFIGTISGIILKPLPIPVITLIGLHICTMTKTLDLDTQSLKGFSSPEVWLIVFVFFIARGFIKTKLGHRIAYSFVALLGRYTIGLGYGVILTELIVGPAIPSSSARAGGIIYPIVKSISETLGSHPDDGTARKLGSFLTMTAFQGNLIVSAMFLTGAAANSMAQDLAAKQGIFFSWMDWFVAALVPGLCSILIIPVVLYLIYPPQLKVLPQAASIAKKNLRDMGAMTSQELTMLGVFLMMVSIWVFGGQYDIPAIAAGLFGVCILFITGILTWQDVLQEHEAWTIVVWLSILIMMSGYLETYGIVSWFSTEITSLFTGLHSSIAIFGIALIYFYSHYFFASSAAYVGAMYSTSLAIAISTGAPPLISALVLGFFISISSGMTHYSNGSAVLFFGMGYVEIGEWWLYGFIVSLVNLCIWLGAGYFWWHFLGLI